MNKLENYIEQLGDMRGFMCPTRQELNQAEAKTILDAIARVRETAYKQIAQEYKTQQSLLPYLNKEIKKYI